MAEHTVPFPAWDVLCPGPAVSVPRGNFRNPGLFLLRKNLLLVAELSPKPIAFSLWDCWAGNPGRRAHG